MRIHLACATNERYAPHAAALLRSAIAYNPPESIAVHYVHGGDLSQKSQNRLRRILEPSGAQIEFLSIDPALAEGLPVLKQLPAVMWYRVFLPQLLPQLPRVLYLDSDMVIADSLAPLWNCDLGGNWVGAVTAPFPETLQHWPAHLGLPGIQSYFGSGVLLFDLERMRQAGAQEKILAYGRAQGNALHWPDQDALNAVLHAHRLHLHPRWNFSNGIVRRWGSEDVFLESELAEAGRHPAIIHFEGHNVGKPWQPGCRHPYRHLYFHHLSRTPWRWELPSRPPREILRGHYRVIRSWLRRLLKPDPPHAAPIRSVPPTP